MKKYPVLRLLNGGNAPGDGEARDYGSVRELLAAEHSPAIIIIDSSRYLPGEGRAYYEDILNLRQSPVFCYAPIFFTRSVCGLDILADGVSDDIGAIEREGGAILARGERVKASSLAGSYKLRMLSYMYARGSGYELTPYCVPGSKWIYGYPAAAVIMEREPQTDETCYDCRDIRSYNRFVFDDKEMAAATKWIRNLQRRGYTEHTAIYDRIRLCPKCQTGHLNYVDVCPNCGSLNIAKKRMLHCFTCGNVAPESDFRRDFSLVCPRCDTKLRHIGSDYDHPLESYQCEDCGSSFVEADVKVSCLNCGAQSLPGELTINNFYGYRLGERGEEAVRTGIISEDFTLFGGTNVVSIQTFCSVVKWLSSFRGRYPDAGFSLLRVKLIGLSEAEDVIGAAELRKLIAELDTRIRASVRETDITTLDEDGTFWLILPRTSLDGGTALAKRLEEMSSLFGEQAAGKLGLSAKCFMVSDAVAKMPPQELLKKLAKED